MEKQTPFECTRIVVKHSFSYLISNVTISPRYVAYANTKEAPLVNIIDLEKFLLINKI